MQKTIANGASLTSAIQLDRNTLLGIGFPAAWTTADLTFQASLDNVTFYDMRNASGGELTVPSASVVAGDWIAFSPDDFRSALFLKIRSGTSATPVNQGADRVLALAIGAPV